MPLQIPHPTICTPPAPVGCFCFGHSNNSVSFLFVSPSGLPESRPTGPGIRYLLVGGASRKLPAARSQVASTVLARAGESVLAPRTLKWHANLFDCYCHFSGGTKVAPENRAISLLNEVQSKFTQPRSCTGHTPSILVPTTALTSI